MVGNEHIWIFGYGSLICPEGINHRGLRWTYGDDDLAPARLSGFKRSWEARSPTTGHLYLGVSENDGSVVNGTIFPLHLLDVAPFMESENSIDDSGMYRLVEVTDGIDVLSDFKGSIFTCVTRAPTHEGHILPWYQERVEEGLQLRGPEFREEFFRTTDWSAFQYQKIINAWQLELVGPE